MSLSGKALSDLRTCPNCLIAQAGGIFLGSARLISRSDGTSLANAKLRYGVDEERNRPIHADSR